MQTLYYLGGEMAARGHAVRRVRRAHVAAPPDRHGQDRSAKATSASSTSARCGTATSPTSGARPIVGRPNRRQQEVYTAVYAGLMAGIERMRPGQTNADVADAIIAKIAEHDLGRPPVQPVHRPRHRHRCERAAVHRRVPARRHGRMCSNPNMVFAVEPLVWVPDVRGGGGVRHRGHGARDRVRAAHPLARGVRGAAPPVSLGTVTLAALRTAATRSNGWEDPRRASRWGERPARPWRSAGRERTSRGTVGIDGRARTQRARCAAASHEAERRVSGSLDGHRALVTGAGRGIGRADRDRDGRGRSTGHARRPHRVRPR